MFATIGTLILVGVFALTYKACNGHKVRYLVVAVGVIMVLTMINSIYYDICTIGQAEKDIRIKRSTQIHQEERNYVILPFMRNIGEEEVKIYCNPHDRSDVGWAISRWMQESMDEYKVEKTKEDKLRYERLRKTMEDFQQERKESWDRMMHRHH